MNSRRIFKLSSLLRVMPVVAICCSGCALGIVPLSADQIDSQVVDADTGTPIEGVAVVAYWELNKGSLVGDSLPCGAANVEEAVTDKDGRFHMPGWGPVKNPCGGVMREGEPLIYLFKPGYHYGKIPVNGFGSIRAVSSTGSGWWDSHQMKLSKFEKIDYTSPEVGSYFRDFNILDGELQTFVIYMPSECNWKKIPYMLRLLEQERQKFIIQGYPVGGLTWQLIDNDQWFMKVAPQCGSTKVFMRGLLK